jgi:hypothetical protein
VIIQDQRPKQDIGRAESGSMNLKDFTKEDITLPDLKRLGASEPHIYMHKDGKTIMVPKSKEQEYAKQGYQKSSLKAETKVNERMPASVIKHKERLAHMTDQELADRHGDTDEQRLRQMAWRHGYGKMSSHYVDRIRRAKQKVEGLQEDYSRMTKELITKLVKQGKTDDEIQQATGETGLRIRLIRKSVDYDKKEEAIKLAEENARRDFMKKAAAGMGAVALGTMAPSVAWPDEPPENFDFMDQFFSDKILNDPKYKDFKLKGNDFLKMMKDLQDKWEKDKQKKKNDGSIEV